MANRSNRTRDRPDEPRFAVGTRVVCRMPLDASSSTDAALYAAGVIVDDFGDVLVAHDSYGRDWAISKRWAVALDGGSLVFRDDDELDREFRT